MTPRAATLALLGLLHAAHAAADPEQRWQFTVRLDDRKIGQHVFEATGTGMERRITSHAQFTVEWLRIPVFRYRHESHERWREGCLDQIESATHSNGHAESVRGARTADGFRLDSPSSTLLPQACVMTFAYWDRRILEQKALLNAQTGVYTPIEVRSLGREMIPVAGVPRPAERYLLKAGELHIELWYAPEGQWLGLAAPTRDGRRMTYRLEG